MSFKEVTHRVLISAKLTPIYDAFGGLSEFYAFVFTAAGITLAFRGKLDGNFAGMIVAVQGILVAHDAIDGYLQSKAGPNGNK